MSYELEGEYTELRLHPGAVGGIVLYNINAADFDPPSSLSLFGGKNKVATSLRGMYSPISAAEILTNARGVRPTKVVGGVRGATLIFSKL